MSMQTETNEKKESRVRRFFGMFKDSALEIKSTRNLVICAMMAALAIVLDYTTTFYITPAIKITFSGLPNRMVDYLFGPTLGCIFAGVMDFLKYLLKPEGAFFFGYTLTAMLGGLIYGMFFYRLKIKQPIEKGKTKTETIKNWIKTNLHSILLIFIAEVIVKLFINIGLNTLWSSMILNKAWIILLPGRLVKNLIQIPVDTVLHFFLMKVVQQIKVHVLPNK